MNMQEFHKIVTIGVAKMHRFPPNFKDQLIINAWFHDFKDIDARIFANAMREAAGIFDEFPSMKQLLKLCGKEILTLDQEARKIAEKVIERGGNGSRQDLGDCEYEIAQKLGGPYSIRDLNLLDAAVYNTIRRRLEGLAKEWLEKKKASEIIVQNLEASESCEEFTPKLAQSPSPKQEESKKIPPIQSFKDLMAGIRLGKIT